MDADTFTPKALFKKDIRYEIPTFQRPYVWNQEDQWEPLWDDLRNVAERYLENLEKYSGDRTAAQRSTTPHFMGAVVLQQQPNAIADLETWHVIDGQQRMTTLQILLDATQEVFLQVGADNEARRLLALVENQLVETDADRWKLWPTALDREAFVAAMTNDLSPQGFENSPIVQAHDFFRLQTMEWLQVDDQQVADRRHALETALMGLLTVVAIDLATNDDSFVIFETLNARGTPLNQSDLVKNFVLQRATQCGLDADALHSQTWSALETRHWREEVVQGRIRRPRLDQFLNYWLSMRTADEVQVNDVFPAFRRLVDQGFPVDQAASAVRESADRYVAFEKEPSPSRIATFNYRWRTMQAGAATPLIIWLTTQLEHDDPQLGQTLAVVEDYLVRRMVCRATTKDYNRLFLDAVQLLGQEAPGSSTDALGEFLAAQTADSRAWPDDTTVGAALMDLPLYRLLTRGRLRLVLEGIEEARRTDLSEERVVPHNLTIEHLMPQSWAAHWPLEGTADDDARRLRDRLVHTVGNLALLTGKLNGDVSNGPWTSKVEELDEHATLLVTRDLLKTWGEREWNEESILERGASLARLFTKTWPGPTAWVD